MIDINSTQSTVSLLCILKRYNELRDKYQKSDEQRAEYIELGRILRKHRVIER